jgi:hypothetical protein
LKYNFCSIHNSKNYLGGSNAIVIGGRDAIVVEQRPCYLMKYSIAYDVAQSLSFWQLLVNLIQKATANATSAPCSWQGCKGHIELSAKH